MDIAEFLNIARQDAAIGSFLKKTAKKAKKEHGRQPGSKSGATGTIDWDPILIRLLWLSLPWIRRGWKWMTVKRLELDDQLKEKAVELGLDPDLSAEATPLFLDYLITSAKDDKLRASLLSILDRMEPGEIR